MTTTIRFWGVRGSIASPGPSTAAVGGNTSCVEIECGDTRLVLDAGTGIRRLGQALAAAGPTELTLLLSHLHWDHIQGLPFFAPAYLPGSAITVVGAAAAEMSLEEALAHQMRAPVFPVRLAELAATFRYRHIRSGESLAVGAAAVRAARLNHPGGVTAYRIEHGGCAVVYATDTEHYSCVDPALLELSRGADVLIYDAQYTPEEYAGSAGASKVGWGHSTWEAAVELARAAAVARLVLFHHDPGRSDAEVAAIEDRARALFPAAVAAREGMTIELPEVAAAAAA